MPSYLSPGVYVEEVSSGSKPIEGVGTAVAAFVGFAEKGPLNEPVLVTNWTQFTQTFGEFVEGALPRRIRSTATSSTAAAARTSYGSAVGRVKRRNSRRCRPAAGRNCRVAATAGRWSCARSMAHRRTGR